MTDTKDDFWKDAAVISVYSDADAVADGVLVKWDGGERIDGKPINRITRAVWDTYTRTIGGVMTDITPMVACIKRVLAEGKRDGDWLTFVPFDPALRTLWCIPNEVGGYTAMFPSCY